MLISGTKSGEVIVWRDHNFDCMLSPAPGQASSNPWVIFKVLNDHDRQIASVFINECMGMFVTGSYDGTANLYNLHTAKCLRTFRHPTLAPIYSAVIA